MGRMLFGMIRPATIVHAKAAIVWLRILSSFAWIDSAFIGKNAKLAPAFVHGPGLAQRIHDTFVHSALDPRIAHLLTTVVAPHAALFAALIAIADVAIGASLLLGLLTRFGSAVAITRAVTNILVAGGLGADTVGFNAMLAAAAAICMWTAAGRKLGLDGALINRYPKAGTLRLVA